MSDNSDSAFDATLERLALRAFDEGLVQERDQVQADIAVLKSRGIRLTGSTPRHELEIAWKMREDRSAKTVQTVGRRLIGEAIDALQRMLGELTQQTLDQLRNKLPAWFDRIAQDYMSDFSPTAGEGLVSSIQARMDLVKNGLQRDLEIELAPFEFRARLNTIASGYLTTLADRSAEIDVFISHAREDKDDVARPLKAELEKRGLSVWLDEAELIVGRSLFRTIEDGLRRCRFGVVILSPSFFQKEWPRRELSALAALSDASDRDMILPIWHNVDFKAVARGSPLLADVHAANTSGGIARVAAEIATAIARVARN